MFPALISGEKISGTKGRQTKNFRLALGSAFALPKPVFALQNPPFAVLNLLSSSKISFSHSVNCFTHSKYYIIYFGNDFSHHRKGKSPLFTKNMEDSPPPPPRFNNMSCGRFKKILRPEGTAKQILLLQK